MAQQATQQTHPLHTPQDELILVVKREHLLPAHQTWQGLKTDNMDSFVEIIKTHQEFMPRSRAEVDERYKQIIPYAVFRFQDRYFLMQRKASSTEQRLKSKYTLGIGGHVRKEDMDGASIFDWALREFHEEVHFSGNLTHTTLGLLNDDSNEVGRVHLGLVLLIDGDSSNISVRSELAQGFLASMDEFKLYEHQMESWTATIVSHLQSAAI